MRPIYLCLVCFSGSLQPRKYCLEHSKMMRREWDSLCRANRFAKFLGLPQIPKIKISETINHTSKIPE